MENHITWILFAFISVSFIQNSVCEKLIRCLYEGVNNAQLRLSCQQDEMLRINSVIMGKTATADTSCENIAMSESDCKPFDSKPTEYARRSCHFFSTCTWFVPYTMLPQCSSQGKVYVAVDYYCMSRKDPFGNYLAQIYALRREQLVEDKPQVLIQSLDYPNGFDSFQSATCTVTLPPRVYGRFDIMDMSHNGSSQTSPYCLQVDNALYGIQCAGKGSMFPIITIPPSTDLPRTTKFQIRESGLTHNLGVSFWILLSALHADTEAYESMTVYCSPDSLLSTTPVTMDWLKTRSTDISWYTSTFPTSPLPASDQNIGIIIGGVVAGIVVITAVVIIAWILVKRRNKKSEEDYAYVCHANIAAATKLGATMSRSKTDLTSVGKQLHQPPYNVQPYAYSNALQPKITNTLDRNLYSEISENNKRPWEKDNNVDYNPYEMEDDIYRGVIDSPLGGSESWVPPGGKNNCPAMLPPAGHKAILPPSGKKPVLPPSGKKPVLPTGARGALPPPAGETVYAISSKHKDIRNNLEQMYSMPQKNGRPWSRTLSSEVEIVENDLYA